MEKRDTRKLYKQKTKAPVKEGKKEEGKKRTGEVKRI